MTRRPWSTTPQAGVSPLVRVLGTVCCRSRGQTPPGAGATPGATGARRRACWAHTGSPAGA